MAASLSIAMIVRDEAANLPEWLACFRDLADEICIVDTGSTDDTVAIAHNHGCRVSAFAWCGDFAAARNASLDRCTKEWVFVVDADERIASDDLPLIRALISDTTAIAYRFTTRNYTHNKDMGEFHPSVFTDPYARGFPGWHPSDKVRLFRQRLGIQFVGEVHELVEPSLRQLRAPVSTTSIPVHHYGAMKPSPSIRSKQAMYIQLGLEKTRQNPEDAKAFAELGVQYAEIGEYRRSASAFRESVRLDPTQGSVFIDLGGILHLLGHPREAAKAIRIGVKLDSRRTDGWRNLGVVLIQLTEPEEASVCFERALELNPDWTDGYRYYSVALEQANRLNEAADAARRAVEHDSESSEAVRHYVSLMKRMGRASEMRNFFCDLQSRGVRAAIVDQMLQELSE